MRPRIKSNRVNVSKVVEHLERKRVVYTEAINDLMNEEGVTYSRAKELINKRSIERILFKF